MLKLTKVPYPQFHLCLQAIDIRQNHQEMQAHNPLVKRVPKYCVFSLFLDTHVYVIFIRYVNRRRLIKFRIKIKLKL